MLSLFANCAKRILNWRFEAICCANIDSIVPDKQPLLRSLFSSHIVNGNGQLRGGGKNWIRFDLYLHQSVRRSTHGDENLTMLYANNTRRQTVFFCIPFFFCHSLVLHFVEMFPIFTHRWTTNYDFPFIIVSTARLFAFLMIRQIRSRPRQSVSWERILHFSCLRPLWARCNENTNKVNSDESIAPNVFTVLALYHPGTQMRHPQCTKIDRIHNKSVSGKCARLHGLILVLMQKIKSKRNPLSTLSIK